MSQFQYSLVICHVFIQEIFNLQAKVLPLRWAFLQKVLVIVEGIFNFRECFLHTSITFATRGIEMTTAIK